MEEKITIIEGPAPTFEATTDGWVLGLNESPNLADIVLTRLRTHNGRALVERCHRAWRNKQSIHLEFRSSDGLLHQTPIVAARFLQVEEGDILSLWLRLTDEDIKLELDYDDFGGEDIDDSDLFK